MLLHYRTLSGAIGRYRSSDRYGHYRTLSDTIGCYRSYRTSAHIPPARSHTRVAIRFAIYRLFYALRQIDIYTRCGRSHTTFRYFPCYISHYAVLHLWQCGQSRISCIQLTGVPDDRPPKELFKHQSTRPFRESPPPPPAPSIAPPRAPRSSAAPGFAAAPEHLSHPLPRTT